MPPRKTHHRMKSAVQNSHQTMDGDLLHRKVAQALNKVSTQKCRRIGKDELLTLLSKREEEMIIELRRSHLGLMAYLEEQKYTEEDDEYQIIEIVLKILSRSFSLQREKLKAHKYSIVRMLKNSQKFLFGDIPRVLHSCVSERHDINLIQFMSNYMTVLQALLCRDIFPCEKILDIFPTLENYMNRLQERKISNLDKAVECFRNLRREVEKFEDPTDLNENEEEEESAIANFRSLSVVPRTNDIINYEVYNIPQNIVDAAYRSVDHFLSVHYRLTREDMLRTFRKCINAHISSRDDYSRQANSRGDKTYYFENVSVGYPPEYAPKGIIYYIKASTSKEIDWSKKEILMPGSLVFLTPNSFRTVVFATVLENPVVDHSRSKSCRLKIKLEDDLYQDTLMKDTVYTMIQPAAYFECYKHVLSGIKGFTESNFPLSDIIVYFDYSDPEPEYLRGREYCLNEKCEEVEGTCSCKFNPLKDSDWPTSSDLELDEQQYNAFKIALTKKVAVIQGPPGTGKTHIGLKVVKTLLRNVDHKPIVICCLTNHALDQFLERILEFSKKVVRLGSQSKSEVLEPHKLENLIYAIRQHQENINNDVATIENEVTKNSLKLVKSMASDTLTQRIEVERDEEYCVIKLLCRYINSELVSYAKCLDKYLEEDALNDIISSNYKEQLRHRSGILRKSVSAGLMEWLVCSHSSDLYDKCSKKFHEIRMKKGNHLEPGNIEDIFTLAERKRFELFYYWRDECLSIRKKRLEESIEMYRKLMHNDMAMPVDPVKLEILKGADIIGVTTTGACKFKQLLRRTEPRIIVIEEAAQVLESHVISSLVPSVQHLILIGDHEQLRPLPADHDLSEKYNLKISMFERLFLNGAPSATLITQHRMKPCIAELLVPRPYKEYKSFENVYKYEEIKGVESSVFFFDHGHFEDDNSSGNSSSNDFEARMIVSLAKYFKFIHYSEKQITIITTYTLQVVYILNYLKEENLEGIHVTTVDNYQGEENDIILVSFVRSNETAIGFLKESNRVCVALSRAREGMFCFGNFQLYARKNELWKDIVEKLKDKNMIGDTLSLKCPKHDIGHSAKCSNDILKFLTRGCSEECKSELSCGHTCSRKCHFDDPDHSRYICKEPCKNMIDETRICPRRCFEKCKKVKRNAVELPCGHTSSRADSKCCIEFQKRLPCRHLVTVPCYVDTEQYQCKASERIILDCGHEKSIYCFQKQENLKVTCTELRPEIGPCGHTVEVPCNMHFEEEELFTFCVRSCGILLDCGHPCERLCRLCFDTGIHGFCRQKCKLSLTCGHECEGYCGSPCPPCEKTCFMSCGHHEHCSNDCLRSCIHCEKPCLRKCKHKSCSKSCWENCDIDPCTEQCFETLPCGHQCIGFCGDPCPLLCRVCHAGMLKNSGTNNCFYVLECEHVVEAGCLNEHINNCLLTFEWPCCPECCAPITNSLRYKKELRQAKQICIENRDTSEEHSKVLYLVRCMYDKECIIPAKFLDIHKNILQILKGSAQWDTLLVLKNCVILLRKLVIIDSELNKYDCDEYIERKFATLMMWIYCHLTQASYQQLSELETAITQLRNRILTT